MELARSACSKEHHKIYAGWFAVADPGMPPRRALDLSVCVTSRAPESLADGLVRRWWVVGGVDGDGRVTGADATKFFAMSGLSRADLKQVRRRRELVLDLFESGGFFWIFFF
jgi:EH domain-containing protein 1